MSLLLDHLIPLGLCVENYLMADAARYRSHFNLSLINLAALSFSVVLGWIVKQIFLLTLLFC